MLRSFVSAPGQLRERWVLAFPDVQVVSQIAELGILDRSMAGSLWLDLSGNDDLGGKSLLRRGYVGWLVKVVIQI